MSGGANACWPWMALRDRDGYGSFSIDNRPHRANRVALIISIGELQTYIHACHRCDNPACCNPEHLFPGTNADNQHDSVIKGRRTGVIVNEVMLLELRNEYTSGKTLRDLAHGYHIGERRLAKLCKGILRPPMFCAKRYIAKYGSSTPRGSVH
jgi:hypothetical protein